MAPLNWIELIAASSVLILAVLLIRIFFRKLISRRAQYALWGIVLFRLLIPVNLFLPHADHSLIAMLDPFYQELSKPVQSEIQGETAPEESMSGQTEQKTPEKFMTGQKTPEEFMTGQTGQTASGEPMSGQTGQKTLEEFMTWQTGQTAPGESMTGQTGQTAPGSGSGTEFVEAAAGSQHWEEPGVTGGENDGYTVNRYGIAFGVLKILRTVLWSGMIVTFLWFFLTNLNFYRKLRKSRQPVLNLPTEYEGRHKVYLSDQIPAPCLFGFPHPAIYVTGEAAGTPERLKMILAHEEMHASHLDWLWVFLRSICLILYWYHPFVWAAAYFSKLDCELACDESVIAEFDTKERIFYGETLLSLVPVRRKKGDFLLSATTMTGGKRNMKERIVRIAESSRKNSTAAVLSLAAVLLLTCGIGIFTFTGHSKTEKAEPDDPEINDFAYGEQADSAAGEPSADRSADSTENDFFREEGFSPVTLLTEEGVPGFFYRDKQYDLREINESINAVTGCRSAGNYVVFRGNVSPYNIYCIFDTATESFVKSFSGANFVWESDDVTYGAYSLENGVYDYEGNLLVSFPLEQTETISRLSFREGEKTSPDSSTRLLEITVQRAGDGRECTMLLDLIPDDLTRSYYKGNFVDLCGVDGFLAEGSDSYPEYREYFIRVPGGALRFAWGSYLGEEALADTFLDLDGDGVRELICNTKDRIENTRTVYVYQLRDGRIWQGKIEAENFVPEEFKGLPGNIGTVYEKNPGDFRLIQDRKLINTVNGLEAFTYTEYCILPDTAAEFFTRGELGEELFTYKQTLRRIMALLSEDKNVMLPDGTVLYGQGLRLFDNYDWYDTFCIADIDSDGREELLFTYDPAVTASTVTVIFDTDGGRIRVQGRVWPDSAYYTNGVILEAASHNQSYGDTIWPYSVLVYDDSTDSYQVAGSAASMEKPVGEWERLYYVGREYIPFPEELDLDGDGVLYILSEPEPESESDPENTDMDAASASAQVYDDGTWPSRIVERDEYDAWIGGYLQEAAKIELEWKNFTPENVNAIGN